MVIVTQSALTSLLQKSPEEQKARGYFHTAGEIASQPEVWRKTGVLVHAALPGLSAFLSGTRRLLLSGAGTSHYVSLSLQPLLSGFFDCVEAIASTEIVVDPESALPREPFVLVSFARSGESPESNAVISLAERLRPGLVKQLAVTCNREGALVHLVESLGGRGFVLTLPEESNDSGLAMTSSFSSLCIAGAALAYLDKAEEYDKLVERFASLGGSMIDRASDLGSRLASEDFERAFFVASRPFLGGAFEARLKVQELTAGTIIGSTEDSLGFRHGPLAAVNDRSLIVVFLSSDARRRRYELDLLGEIRGKRLGKRLVAASSDVSGLSGLADFVLDFGANGLGGAVPDSLLSVFVGVTGQLIGLFASLGCGLRPDEPSPDGVISRVVHGVRIYPENEER
ncbi:MAG TPA: sugar isomerase [Rectinemataceae bacterium]|nr:sugar isomerase [Rectinemataceae bacterium]